MTLEGLRTVINDLSEPIEAETRIVTSGSRVLEVVNIPPSASHTFSLERGDVVLVLVKQGQRVSVSLQGSNQVIYASDMFPSENLQTITNDFTESIEAEIRIINPGSPVPKAQNIPSAGSLTFALGPLGANLVVIAKIGDELVEANFPINHNGGKQVKYASELFPPPNSA